MVHALFGTLLPLLAEGEAEPSGGAPLTQTLVMIGIMFLIFYFLVIRPQKKREDERQAMLGKLKKNDRVVTQSGLHGIVARVDDTEVVLKVDLDQKVRIKFSRSAIASIVTGDASKSEPAKK